jgi:methylthioribose-1-phosphate isomerase
MIVDGKQYQSIWQDPDNPEIVSIINQNLLPFEFRVEEMNNTGHALEAIKEMKVRGAPLIGVTGAFGVYLACIEALKKGKGITYVYERADLLRSARPTAVNLAWAVDSVLKRLAGFEDMGSMVEAAGKEAARLMEVEKDSCFRIGEYGQKLIEKKNRDKNGTVNILTHCNAGWLACVDYGTATAPIYLAHDRGIPVHVWVDETRPRNQGARLTAWELGKHGVPHTVIVDNAGGHLMQNGLVDMVIVGSDRTTRTGDVANKIGTYLKALAARDNRIPFYVALPSSSIDFSIRSGLDEIPIEERDPSEVLNMDGWTGKSQESFLVMPEGTDVSNFGFDITPSKLVTGLITEKGICEAGEEGIMGLFPGQ